MVATQFSGSERRAVRWMRRRGLGLHPTSAAFGVLYAVVTALLAARASTADAVAFGFGVVAVGTIVALVLRSGRSTCGACPEPSSSSASPGSR